MMNISWVRWSSIVAFASVLLAAGACGEDETSPHVSPDAGPDVGADVAQLSHDELLQGLGVKLDLPKDPVGPDGKPLPKGYHPLRKPFTAFQPKDEIFIGGPTYAGKRQSFFDDGYQAPPYPPIAFNPTQTSWVDSPYHVAITADIDGDGDEEVVIVYFVETGAELRVLAIDRDPSGAFSETTPVVIAKGLTVRPNTPMVLANAIARLNVDDDPADEIAVGFGDLYVLDDLKASFATLALVPYGSPYVMLDSGDLDAAPGDKTDEMVVTYSRNGLAFFDVFDGLTKIQTRDTVFTMNDSGRSNHSYTAALVKLANIDRDPADEIIFAGERREWLGHFDVSLMDDLASGLAWYRSTSFHINPNENYDLNYFAYTLQPVDFDGDGRKEIFVDRYLLSFNDDLPSSSSTETTLTFLTGVTVKSALIRTPVLGFDIHVGLKVLVTGRVAPVRAGNINAVADTTANRGGQEIVGYDLDGATLVVGGYDNGNFVWKPIAPVSGANTASALAVGNIDRDSPVVRWDNEHELLYSDPEIVAALAAPPFYSDKEQSLSNCYTSFGKATASSTSASESMGLTVGWSIGYEADLPFDLGSASLTTSFEANFDKITTLSHELTESITYGTGPEDSVVFTTVPFDVYYYTIVSSPKAADVGRRLSLNIPRKPQTLLASATFFDAHNGTLPDSTPLFRHTLGNPRSYPSIATRDADCPEGCYKSRVATVGEGQGFTEVSISSTDATSTTTSFDATIKVEAESNVLGFKAGVSAGYKWGWSYEVATSKSTVFTGHVANLYKLTPENAYSFGLYSHLLGFKTGKVLVVDYWQE